MKLQYLLLSWSSSHVSIICYMFVFILEFQVFLPFMLQLFVSVLSSTSFVKKMPHMCCCRQSLIEFTHSVIVFVFVHLCLSVHFRMLIFLVKILKIQFSVTEFLSIHLPVYYFDMSVIVDCSNTEVLLRVLDLYFTNTSCSVLANSSTWTGSVFCQICDSFNIRICASSDTLHQIKKLIGLLSTCA